MDSERRADTLAVLQQLIPPTFDVRLLGGSRTVPAVYFGRTDGGRTQHFTALPVQLPATEAQQRKFIYKCIRRHVTKLLGGCTRVRTQPVDKLAHINQGDEALYPSMKMCPRSQALALWRLHFETLDGDKRSLTLREAALNWPWGATADCAAWAGYVLASFHAAVAAFDTWRQRAGSLPDDNVLGVDRPKARELFMEFSPLLSPTRLPTFPAISALKSDDSAPG